MMISVTILTRNSEAYLEEVLRSLVRFNEVLIYDNGSTDKTLSIAREFPNVAIHEGPFLGFGPTHNEASNLARNDWILSVDSDEVVSEEMLEAVFSLALDENTVYAFSRKNYYNGRWIRWCGWSPDYQMRLYHRKKTRFTSAQVHEAIMTKGMTVERIEAFFIHYSYSSLSDFLAKMQSYSSLFAAQNCGKKASSPLKAINHGLFAFFKSYFLKKGWMGGFEGFVISIYNSHTAFYKYLKLYEANLLLESTKMADAASQMTTTEPKEKGKVESC